MNKLTARLVAVLLIAGFHFSGCAGSISSLSIAFATDATVQDDTTLMSRFVISCNKTEESEETTQATSGCADGKTCLQRLHQFGMDRLVIPLGNEVEQITVWVEQRIFIAYNFTNAHLLLARSGPLYEQAPLIAHSMVKRE